jgi:hypothetical protein
MAVLAEVQVTLSVPRAGEIQATITNLAAQPIAIIKRATPLEETTTFDIYEITTAATDDYARRCRFL